jgi:hypothetical protein
MSEYNILTVFKSDGFVDNAGSTFDHPVGGGESWNGRVYMVTDAGTALTGGNGTANLTIKVRSGDVINWLDTPIRQGKRFKNPDLPDCDILVYGMRKGNNWSDALDDLTGSTQNMSHAYISSNFDSRSKPEFMSVTFPNNMCSVKAKEVKSTIRVTYYLKVAKLDLTDPDNIKVLGWYEIDPTIEISPR